MTGPGSAQDQPSQLRPLARGTGVALLTVILGVTASLAVTGCGLLTPDTYTIRVDSLTVTPSAAAGQVRIRAHGIVGSDGCSRLDRVEREARGDTLIRRFVGEQRSGNCIQMPSQLGYTEEIMLLPGRSVWYLVRQPDGAPLIRDMTP